MKRPVYARLLCQSKLHRKTMKSLTSQQVWDKLPSHQKREMILTLASMLVRQLPIIRQKGGGQNEQSA